MGYLVRAYYSISPTSYYKDDSCWSADLSQTPQKTSSAYEASWKFLFLIFIISPTRYYKDDLCWSADLKSNTTEDVISIGSFMEVLVLNHYVLVRKLFVVSILKGFTDEPPLEENDDLFDLESKENDWKKILYDAPIDDLINEDKSGESRVHPKGLERYQLVIFSRNGCDWIVGYGNGTGVVTKDGLNTLDNIDQGLGVPFEYSRILFTVVRCVSFGLDCYLAHKTVENWISSFVRVKYISDPIIPLYEVSLIGLPTRSGPKLFGGTMGVFTKELSEISYFLSDETLMVRSNRNDGYASMVGSEQRAKLCGRIGTLERDNIRLRGMLDVERQRVDRLQCSMSSRLIFGVIFSLLVSLRSSTYAKNMLVEVGKFIFPSDFVILKMEEDSKVSLILGRPFLHTADAIIRVKQNQLILGVVLIPI
ncbi:reverse transcriptase domain-containing protein [Tanacetum coccineum]